MKNYQIGSLKSILLVIKPGIATNRSQVAFWVDIRAALERPS
jgi:hypothetical protein